MKTKKEFREFYLERRSRLSREEVREKSALLFERVCSLEQYKKADIILAYMSAGNEADTGAFVYGCIEDGKTVALPGWKKQKEAAADWEYIQ